MTSTLAVLDAGRRIEFTFEDMMRYHGPGSPGGVAHAFKVMERAFGLLAPDEPPQRRELRLRTAFGGPGARDGFELVTRAVTQERFVVDRALARPELGRERERFVFEVGSGERSVTLVLRDGFVPPEFIDLARADSRTAEQDARLDELKLEMADRVMGSAASDVYDEAGAAA
ncbi:MAG: hypothetical protein QOE11_3523 [Solirubrobacteraceae bacterium]|jgi:hypothetical protein|nr:hypothetical protein [Solirubrobacteraceae bacterium]